MFLFGTSLPLCHSEWFHCWELLRGARRIWKCKMSAMLHHCESPGALTSYLGQRMPYVVLSCLWSTKHVPGRWSVYLQSCHQQIRAARLDKHWSSYVIVPLCNRTFCCNTTQLKIELARVSFDGHSTMTNLLHREAPFTQRPPYSRFWNRSATVDA